MIEKIVATPAAQAAMEHLKSLHGSLLFYQAGGAMSQAPLCFEEGELLLADHDVLVGRLCGCAFYMSRDQYETWQNYQLIIDLAEGAYEGFSLEGELNERFFTRVRPLTAYEMELLDEQVVRRSLIEA